MLRTASQARLLRGLITTGLFALAPVAMTACSSDDAGSNAPSTGTETSTLPGGAGGSGAGTGGGAGTTSPNDCGTGVPVTEETKGDPTCTDEAPTAEYTCGQQASWGKCDLAANPWMTGFCKASCGICTMPPPPMPACQTCRPAAFSSGVNLAWFSFAGDLPNPSLNLWTEMGDAVHDGGGRIVRWWLHVNGTKTPGWDPNTGLAQPIPAAHIGDLIKILNTAQASGVSLVITLWSFDMMKSDQTDAAGLANNRAFLTDDAARQAYIDNYLVPLVHAVKGHPALYAWDIFNEPEGMTEDAGGWTDNKVPMASIQKTVNWLADAIHTEAPNALVTSSAQTFRTCSTVGSFSNKYADDALVAVGGRPKGILDFYQVHYYAQNGSDVSPFLHPATYWGLDKPLVIGEFWTRDTDGVLANNLFVNLHENGYDGAWAWQYYNVDAAGTADEADYRWEKIEPAISALYAQAAADIDLVCK